MSSEWPVVPVEQVCELIVDCVNKTAPVVTQQTPYRMIRTTNVRNGRIDLAECKYVEKETFEKWTRRARLRRGDVVLTREAPIGEVGLVTEAEGVFLGQRLMQYRANRNVLEPRFLLYSFLSPALQHQFGSHEGSGSVVSHIRVGDCFKFKLGLPPLDVQRNIADLLGALDDRITLQRETNATLEAIAQALYKSWFVDFDPVRAKQEGRLPDGMDEVTAALFPDSFEESELGLVPRGWQVRTMGELCRVTIGGLWGKDSKEDIDLVPAISLRGVDLENLRALGFANDAPMRWVKQSAMEKRRVGQNEVLIASSGAGPCGRPLWGGADFEALYGKPVIFSNFVKRLDCGNPANAIYIDRLLAAMRESKEIWNYINGTSIPNLDDKLLLATKKVVVPSDEALSAFEDVARVIYSKLYSQEAQIIAALRDTLLPRLISGQLRLPEAEAEVLAA